MNTFGKLVRGLRIAEGLTLDSVGKKIGSHKGYVSGIENEVVNPPSVAFVRKLYRAFEKKLQSLGVKATEQDFLELAWVSKAPTIIRPRLQHRIRGNPLVQLRITITEPKPKVVIEAKPEEAKFKPGPALPPDSDLLPGEKEES